MCGEIGALLYCWWERRLTQLLWKTVRRFLKKGKIQLPHDLAAPILGIDPEELKQGGWNDFSTPTYVAVLFTRAETWKQS